MVQVIFEFETLEDAKVFRDSYYTNLYDPTGDSPEAVLYGDGVFPPLPKFQRGDIVKTPRGLATVENHTYDWYITAQKVCWSYLCSLHEEEGHSIRYEESKLELVGRESCF